MLPRIGVYTYDIDLHYVLMDHFCGVSNRQLLHHLITEPLYDIRDKALKRQGNPYILRERHRKWVEYIRDAMGGWIDLPNWADLVKADPDGCCFHGDDGCLCDHLFMDGEEWVLFGDDVDLAYDLIDRLHTPILISDDVQDVVQKLLEANPEMKDLIVLCHDLNAIYVLRSEAVEPCGEVSLSQGDLHAFDELGNGESPGTNPTYVLDDETVEAWFALQREQQKQEEAAC